MDHVEAIVKSNLPNMEKLVQAFGRMTEQVIETAGREIELARAMQDADAVVKEQIKLETIKLMPATISHHLSKLTRVGLLTPKKDQYFQTYSLVGDVLDRTLADVVGCPSLDYGLGWRKTPIGTRFCGPFSGVAAWCSFPCSSRNG